MPPITSQQRYQQSFQNKVNLANSIKSQFGGSRGSNKINGSLMQQYNQTKTDEANANLINANADQVRSATKLNKWATIFGFATATATTGIALKNAFGSSSSGDAKQPQTAGEKALDTTKDSSGKLSAAIENANKTGDWSGVKAEVASASSTKTQNESKIDQIDSTIKGLESANGTTKNEIDGITKDNDKITSDEIPAAKAELTESDKKAEGERDATIKGLEGSISSLEAAKKQPNAPVTELDSQINALKGKIEQAKKDCETKKAENKKTYEGKYAKLTDRQKQNNLKIKEKQDIIAKNTDTIKQTSDEKSALIKANGQLDTKIKEANAALDLRK